MPEVAKKAGTILKIGPHLKSAVDSLTKVCAEAKVRDERMAALEAELKDVREKSRARPGIGMRKDDVEKFSFCRAIKAMASKDLTLAKFERECHEETLKVMKANGYTPKALTFGNDASAGFLVPNEVRNELIELRRVDYILDKIGVRMLPGLQYAPVSFPRQTAAATVTWGAETVAVTPTDQTVDEISLVPKISKTATDLSNELIAKGGPGAEQMVRQDLAEVTIRAHQLAFFEGSGAAGQPKGMVTWAGNTQALGTNADADLQKLALMIQLLAADNIPLNAIKWVFNSADWWLIGSWQILTAASGAATTQSPGVPIATYVQGADPNQPWQPWLHGYPVFTTNAIAAGTCFLADWPDTIFADWGAPVIRATSEGRTNVLANQTTVAMFAEVDVAVRHANSVCTGTSLA